MSKSYPVDADSIISAFSSLSKSWSYIDMHFAADMKSFRGYFPLDEDEVENCFVEMFLQSEPFWNNTQSNRKNRPHYVIRIRGSGIPKPLFLFKWETYFYTSS